jgi:hypothetical protein
MKPRQPENYGYGYFSINLKVLIPAAILEDEKGAVHRESMPLLVEEGHFDSIISY